MRPHNTNQLQTVVVTAAHCVYDTETDRWMDVRKTRLYIGAQSRKEAVQWLDTERRAVRPLKFPAQLTPPILARGA
jgi:V8-like Glu-specific endopeptidase